MIDEDAIRQRWEAVGCKLDERGRRLFAAGEVRTAGWGCLAVVSRITGLARSTINRGADDLDAEPLPKGRVRRTGGGRRAVCETDPGLVPALERLVAPAMLGDPMRPLIWVSKSMEKLAATLTEMGHPISADTVRKELVKLGFSRQSNRKADEGSKHPDRDAQFEHINAKVVAAQARQQPVISVDTKKKELIVAPTSRSRSPICSATPTSRCRHAPRKWRHRNSRRIRNPPGNAADVPGVVPRRREFRQKPRDIGHL